MAYAYNNKRTVTKSSKFSRQVRCVYPKIKQREKNIEGRYTKDIPIIQRKRVEVGL